MLVGNGVEITLKKKETDKHSDTCFITTEMLVLLSSSDDSQGIQ
jgi:hypothetical protein